jgi:hypothetical protein
MAGEPMMKFPAQEVKTGLAVNCCAGFFIYRRLKATPLQKMTLFMEI